MTGSQTKQCQNCKQDFTIEPEDFAFYEKIKVPPPTWCPECRIVRRMTFRNERTLYRRVCDLCKKEVVSAYRADTPFPVYCHDCWWSDKWSAADFARDYDFSKPFFSQLAELLRAVPRVSLLITGNSLRSEYTNIVEDMKNCYLVFEADFDEDCLYSGYLGNSKHVCDSFTAWESQLCYEMVFCKKCYGLHYAFGCEGCVDSYFLRDCVGCQNCFGCVNLRNKRYHIFNEPYPKEDYFKKLKEFDLSSYQAREELRRKFEDFSLRFPRKYAYIQRSDRVVGDFVFNSLDLFQCFGMIESKSSRYTIWSNYDNDIMDSYASGYYAGVLYECQSVFYKTYTVKFCNFCFKGVSDASYSDLCTASSNLFGCVGMRHGEYAILNKRYSKEEYEALVPRITKHMNKVPYVDGKGRVYKYGEFFPPEFSPFAYNETIAQEYFPLTKEQALAQGYRWRDPDTRNYSITKLSNDLPDHIKDVTDDILKETIGCAHAQNYGISTSIVGCTHQCTTAFKIIPEELAFYKRMNLPLPRLCPNCRHYKRLQQRNLLKLWHRACACGGRKSQAPNTKFQYENTATHFHGENPCSNEFETSYAPERKEIVYCESCYNAEVA